MAGFNVLHPMGWDAFGLPAEQYAIDTGTHPSDTTKRNINRFREQLRWAVFTAGTRFWLRADATARSRLDFHTTGTARLPPAIRRIIAGRRYVPQVLSVDPRAHCTDGTPLSRSGFSCACLSVVWRIR